MEINSDRSSLKSSRVTALPFPHDSLISVIVVNRVNVWRLLVVLKVITVTTTNNAFGRVNFKTPSREIKEMDRVIAKFTRSPMPKPMPIIMQHIVAIRLLRRRPLPHRIIEPLRHWGGFAMANRTAMVRVPGTRKENFPDFSRMKRVDRFHNQIG